MPKHRAPHSTHPPRTLAAGASLFAALLISGCGTAPARREPPLPIPPLQTAAGTIVGSAVRFDLRPLGFVPTDGVTLPIFSPDGRYLAVQTGVAPDAAAALGRPGQRPQLASRITMYRIEANGLARRGETEAGLILGRSADNRGFLVESVRPDGARWIGRIDWQTRELDWEVRDGRVNAFAMLGNDGTLAYCSRPTTGGGFDLVIRSGDETRRLRGDGVRSYMYPFLSAAGDRVFAFSLRDGILELLSADPGSDAALLQSAAHAFITDRGHDELALFMCSAQGARDAVEGDDWLVYHRELGSVVRWSERDGIRLLDGGVLARAAVDATREAVLVDGRVRVRPIVVPNDGTPREPGTTVLEQLAVPRAAGTVDGQPAIVLYVPEGGGVRMLVVRILDEGRSSPSPDTPLAKP